MELYLHSPQCLEALLLEDFKIYISWRVNTNEEMRREHKIWLEIL